MNEEMRVTNRGDIKRIVIKHLKQGLNSQDDVENITNDICNVCNIPLPGKVSSSDMENPMGSRLEQ